jgi:hypothetical protein
MADRALPGRECACGVRLTLLAFSANGTGNDTIEQCPSCGEVYEGHNLYRHNLPETKAAPAEDDSTGAAFSEI